MNRVTMFIFWSIAVFGFAGDAYPRAVRHEPMHPWKLTSVSGQSDRIIATPATPRPSAPALADWGVTSDQEDDSVESQANLR